MSEDRWLGRTGTSAAQRCRWHAFHPLHAHESIRPARGDERRSRRARCRHSARVFLIAASATLVTPFARISHAASLDVYRSARRTASLAAVLACDGASLGYVPPLRALPSRVLRLRCFDLFHTLTTET